MHKLRNASGDTEENLRKQLEAIAGDSKVYVLGLGNTDRADDGAGVLVAMALKRFFPTFSFSEQDGVEGTVLDISEKDENLTVFFVDAGDLGMGPGKTRIVRKEEIKETEITTHRVAVALMASVLDRAGKKCAVICIQPERIEFNGQVSAAVDAAVKQVSSALRAVMRSNN